MSRSAEASQVEYINPHAVIASETLLVLSNLCACNLVAGRTSSLSRFSTQSKISRNVRISGLVLLLQVIRGIRAIGKTKYYRP